MKNFGLILKPQKPSDWIAGGFTPLTQQGIKSDGNWTDFLPIVEYQNNGSFDRMDCVTYSLLNCIEALYKFQTGIERNFSDRALAKLSHTTKEGNSLDTVFDTARKFGLVDETLWPDVFTNWDDYYVDVPIEIQNLGYEFLTIWSLYREWISTKNKDLIFNSLKDAPLQVVVAFATGNDLLKPTTQYNHAVCLFNAVYGEYWEIFDHYSQTIKKYHWDYEFGTILKPTLYNKKTMTFIPQDNQLYLLVQGLEQKLAMGYKSSLMIYDEKIDTLLNSASRSKQYQIPKPLTQDEYNSVDKINGKGELIEAKVILN